MSDYRKRKCKCGNCRSWRSQGAEYMGQCKLSTVDNGLMTGPTVKTLAFRDDPPDRLGPLPLQTSEYFHCCLWQRQKAAS